MPCGEKSSESVRCADADEGCAVVTAGAIVLALVSVGVRVVSVDKERAERSVDTGEIGVAGGVVVAVAAAITTLAGASPRCADISAGGRKVIPTAACRPVRSRRCGIHATLTSPARSPLRSGTRTTVSLSSSPYRRRARTLHGSK